MERKYAILLSLLLLCLTAGAQTGRLFNTDNGLSSCFVGHVYQDHDGFIWVSTRNGLNRYDGYNFKVFKIGLPGCDGMKSNYINVVLQSKEKTLFVGNNRGIQTYYNDSFHDVSLYDNNGEKVISFVKSILELHDGTILIGTSGNGVFKVKDINTATSYEPTKSILGVKKMFEDSQKRIWMLTETNEVLVIKNNKILQHLYKNNNNLIFTDICEDSNGRIFISTYDQGIYAQKVPSLDFDQVKGTEGRHVGALYLRRDGKIMVGFDGDGIAILDPYTLSMQYHPYYSYQVDMRHCKACSFVEDRAGNLWVGILQKGVFMQSEAFTGFNYAGYKLGNRNPIGDCCVVSAFIDKKGNSWIGTDRDGLYVLDNEHKQICHFEKPLTVLSIRQDEQGRVWLGSYMSGLGYVDENYVFHSVKVGDFDRLHVFGVEDDYKGNLWLATMGNGLIRYNKETGEIRQFIANPECGRKRKLNALTNGYISSISMSNDKNKVILATTMGLCCYDIKNNSWVNTFGVNVLQYGINVRTVMQDDNDMIWYGTDNGLYGYDMRTRKTVVFDETKGLPDKGIASIIRDKGKWLWVATNHGLCKIDTKSGQVGSCYYVDDGLQSNEFSDGAASVGPDGSLLFGGVGGITWFNTAAVDARKWNATVQITNLIVNGNDISAGEESGFYTITDEPVMMSNHFDLASSDNTFSIQLSTLTYDAPEHISYAYSINGEEWNYLKPGQNEINFSHIPPATYRFKVKALKNGQESEIKEFVISIHAPWYMTRIAYLFYFIIFVGLVYLYFKYRKRDERERLMMQEHKHAEELNEAKIKFFMNISHEIRTPMTLIVTPLVSLLNTDHDPQRVAVYTTIKRNAERILNLINQMMDLRKIEKGMMKMRMRETEFISFVKDICNMFEYQAKTKDIKFVFNHDIDKLMLWIDRSNFDKVVVNLLSNAFKYTPAGGSITVNLTHDDKNMTMKVIDTGEGIPKEMLGKIFERFYQGPISGNNRHLGTGIGLDLANSLVLLHHGDIKAANNEKGGGATFTITIPLGSQHLSEEEMQQEMDTEDKEDAIVNLLEETYQNPETIEVEEQLPTTHGCKPTVVVVEDDIEIQNYLVRELSASFKVTTYGNGQEALVGILKELPDVVVSDIMMPIMDGNTLCAKLKCNIRTNTIPVILLTAMSSDEEKLQGLETGADVYMAKPFNIDILKRTILNLIASQSKLRNKLKGNETQEAKVENVELKTADDKLMERVMKVVNNNMSNPDLNVEFIAREVGLSRVHFYRKMKTLTNQSPLSFIRNIRINQAARLFDAGHQNINDVMYAVGFNNTSSFSTAFKAVFGISPRDYIKDKAK